MAEIGAVCEQICGVERGTAERPGEGVGHRDKERISRGCVGIAFNVVLSSRCFWFGGFIAPRSPSRCRH